MKAYKTSQGNWQLNFSENGVQKTLYLGKTFTASAADRVAKAVTEIVACRDRGDEFSPDLLRQIDRLPPRVRESLERFGLINDIFGLTLQGLCERFLQTKEHLKKGSIKVYQMSIQRLLSYFGTERKISAVTKMEAEKFRADSLKRYALAAVSRSVVVYRGIFRCAAELGVITENLFSKVPAGSQPNEKNQFYVTRKMMPQILESSSNDKERLLFVLARYGGLRIPSEICRMRFRDFTDSAIRIHEATKTGFREVPLFREIREIFERLEGNPDDLIFETRLSGQSAAYTAFKAAIARSGLAAWPKLFINCRSSCTTDLFELGYDEKTLDAVLGNSAKVRSKHYVQFQKEKPYKKVLQDNAVIAEFLRNNGGSFKMDEKEFSLREILGLRDL